MKKKNLFIISLILTIIYFIYEVHCHLQFRTSFRFFDSYDFWQISLHTIIPLLIYLIYLINPVIFFKKYSYVTPILLFFLVLSSAAYFATIGVDPHHDGIMLKPALDVSRGLILFKDTFTQYGAFSTFIQATALKLFGEYLIVLKLLTALFYALISVLLYKISIKFLPKFTAFSSIIIYFLIAPYYSHNFLIWSSVYALFFQLLGTLLLLKALENKSSKLFFWAGVSTSLVFWCRQPVGIFMFLAIIAYFIYQNFIGVLNFKKSAHYLKSFIIGNFIVCLFFFVYLIFNSALYNWWQQSFVYTYKWGKMTTGNYNIFRLISFLFDTADPKGLINIWTLIPFSALLLLIKNYRHKYLTLLIFIAISSWMQYFPRNERIHLFWAATPILPIFTLFIYQLFKKFLLNHHPLKQFSPFAASLLILIIFIPEINFSLREAKKKVSGTYVYLQKPSVLRGIRIYNPDEAQYYTEMNLIIENYFENNPQGNIVNTGPDALYNTFDKRIKNIHPIYINWPEIRQTIYPEYPNLLNQYLQNNHPLVISPIENIPSNYCQNKSLSPTEYINTVISQYCQ